MQNTAGPTIFKTPDINQTTAQISQNPKGWFRKNLILVVIIVLVIAVLAEVIFGGLSLFSPSTARNLNILQPKVNELSSAQISLVPEKSGFRVNETVTVGVKVYTGGYATGSMDLVVKYDPQFLRPQRENFVSVGQIYAEYPPAQVDERGGLIGVSGIPLSDSDSFSGVGEFAKLNFIALKEGQTQISVDYQENSTGDSNILKARSTEDILGVVENANINITASSFSETVSTPESCGSFTQYCQDISGKVGTQVCNAGTMNNSSCSYDSRVTTSCEECRI